jgi:hypothetical protein
VARTQDVWGAEGISGRIKFLPLAWAGMPKTVLGRSPESWLQMQDNFNLHQAKKELDLSEYEPLELAG